MRAAIVVVALVAAAAGLAAGYLAGSAGEETVTETVTETATETSASAVPSAVEETRAALLEAAGSGDYEALRPLIPASGFEYTFGGPVEGGPIGYWRELERTTGERPLEILASILKMPYVLSRGYYVWPWAYTLTSAGDLSEHERALLAPLGPLDRLFVPDTGYLGWRTGIAPDGTWTFFVAGD
jgi:hypothetical protein